MNHYEIFLKVAETGNITKAAEILNYTQSGVSHAIAALEKETGFPLFIRSKSGVSLTENAKMILPDIRRLVGIHTSLKENISMINNEVKGTLRLGVFTSMITEYLPDIMNGFKEEYSDVEFELMHGTYDEICEIVRNGKVNLGFLPSPYYREFDYELFTRDAICAVVPADHALAKKEKIALEEIIKYPLISQFKGCEKVFDEILADCYDEAEIKYLLYEDTAMMSMVERGFGVGLSMESSVEHTAFNVIGIPLEEPIMRDIYLVSKKGEPEGFLSKVFREYLKNFS